MILRVLTLPPLILALHLGSLTTGGGQSFEVFDKLTLTVIQALIVFSITLLTVTVPLILSGIHKTSNSSFQLPGTIFLSWVRPVRLFVVHIASISVLVSAWIWSFTESYSENGIPVGAQILGGVGVIVFLVALVYTIRILLKIIKAGLPEKVAAEWLDLWNRNLQRRVDNKRHRTITNRLYGTYGEWKTAGDVSKWKELLFKRIEAQNWQGANSMMEKTVAILDSSCENKKREDAEFEQTIEEVIVGIRSMEPAMIYRIVEQAGRLENVFWKMSNSLEIKSLKEYDAPQEEWDVRQELIRVIMPSRYWVEIMKRGDSFENEKKMTRTGRGFRLFEEQLQYALRRKDRKLLGLLLKDYNDIRQVNRSLLKSVEGLQGRQSYDSKETILLFKLLGRIFIAFSIEESVGLITLIRSYLLDYEGDSQVANTFVRALECVQKQNLCELDKLSVEDSKDVAKGVMLYMAVKPLSSEEWRLSRQKLLPEKATDFRKHFIEAANNLGGNPQEQEIVHRVVNKVIVGEIQKNEQKRMLHQEEILKGIAVYGGSFISQATNIARRENKRLPLPRPVVWTGKNQQSIIKAKKRIEEISQVSIETNEILQVTNRSLEVDEILKEMEKWVREGEGKRRTLNADLELEPEGRTLLLRGELSSGRSFLLNRFFRKIEGDERYAVMINYEQLDNFGISIKPETKGRERFLGELKALAALKPILLIFDQLDSFIASREEREGETLSWIRDLQQVPNITLVISVSDSARAELFEASLRITDVKRLDSVVKDIIENELQKLKSLQHIDAAEILRFFETPVFWSTFAHVVTESEISEGSSFEPAFIEQQVFNRFWEMRVSSSSAMAEGGEKIRAIEVMVEYMTENETFQMPKDYPVGNSREDVNWAKAAAALEAEKVVRLLENLYSFPNERFFWFACVKILERNSVDLFREIQGLSFSSFNMKKVRAVLRVLRASDKNKYFQIINRFLVSTQTTNLPSYTYREVWNWLLHVEKPFTKEMNTLERALVNSRNKSEKWGDLNHLKQWYEPLFKKGLLRPDPNIDQKELEARAQYITTVGSSNSDITGRLIEQWSAVKIGGRDWGKAILTSLREWDSAQLRERYVDFVRGIKAEEFDLIQNELIDIIEAEPVDGCRLLGVLLKKIWGEKDRFEDNRAKWSFLKNRGVPDKLIFCANEAPGAFTEYVLEPLHLLIKPSKKELIDGEVEEGKGQGEYFPDDPISNLIEDDELKEAVFKSAVQALLKLYNEETTSQKEVAQQEKNSLRALDKLQQVYSRTAQAIAAAVYTDIAHVETERSFNFLQGDPRRLNLYHSRKEIGKDLCKSLGKELHGESFRALEIYLLENSGKVQVRDFMKHSSEKKRRKAIISELNFGRGRDQLELLQLLPEEKLSRKAKKRLQELERKFPRHYVTLEHAPSMQMVRVEPPIRPEQATKMNNKAWVRAMEHFPKNEDVSYGRSKSLGGILVPAAAKEPSRFYNLARDFQDKTEVLSYFPEIIQGLLENSEYLERALGLAVMVLSKRCLTDEEEWSLYQKIRKIVESGFSLPSALRGVLLTRLKENAGTREVDLLESNNKRDLHFIYLNSERGAAAETLWTDYLKRSDKKEIEELADLILQTSEEVLYVGLIIHMSQALHQFEKSTEIFRIIVQRHPSLLWEEVSFMYMWNYTLYSRAVSFLGAEERLLSEPDITLRKKGAKLRALGTIFSTDPEVLRKIINEDEQVQIAAVQVFIQYFKANPEWCAQMLLDLAEKGSSSIRENVAKIFQKMPKTEVWKHKGFVEDLISMNIGGSQLYDLAQIIEYESNKDPEWAVNIFQQVVQMLGEGAGKEFAIYRTGEILRRSYEELQAQKVLEGQHDILDDIADQATQIWPNWNTLLE